MEPAVIEKAACWRPRRSPGGLRRLRKSRTRQQFRADEAVRRL